MNIQMNIDGLIEEIRSKNEQMNVLIKDVRDVYNSDLDLIPYKGLGLYNQYEDFIVLGCGGTGSWFAPKLIKMLNDALAKEFIENARVLFIDGDSIEAKNLIRQNFVSNDIGKNKAEVMAQRYGMHASSRLEVGYIDSYIVNDSYKIPEEYADKFVNFNSIDVLSKNKRNFIIINLIDNGKTRKMVHEWVYKKSSGYHDNNFLIIDVANNEYNGQLNLTNYCSVNPSSFVSQFYNCLPEQLRELDDISTFSCADEDAESEDQLFNANDMAASVLGNYLNSIIMERKVYFAKIDFVTGGIPSITPSYQLIKWPRAYRNFSNTTDLALYMRDSASYDFEFKALVKAINRLEENEQNLFYDSIMNLIDESVEKRPIESFWESPERVKLVYG